MKKIIYILFVLLISCKNHKKHTLISIKNNTTQNKEAAPLEKKQKTDTLKVINSLHRDVEFYTLNEFKGYEYVEIEPYDEFLTDDKNNMYHIVIYKKEQFKYALLVVLEKNINEGELSPIWKKTKKK